MKITRQSWEIFSCYLFFILVLKLIMFNTFESNFLLTSNRWVPIRCLFILRFLFYY